MINSINLQNFRNFKKKVIDFSEKLTVIVGPNASGKTNILESLYLLSSGKSFKAQIEEEMIGYTAEIARISGKMIGLDLEAILTRDVDGWPKKRLLVNGVPKRLIDFAGNFKVVLFGPWDLDLVTESPSLRRRFLDSTLSQVDREYRRAILSYDKGLRQRNRLLFRIREEGISRGQLLFWNQLLIKNGDYISGRREELINFINSKKDINNTKFEISYDKSSISEGRLKQYVEEEIAAGTTLVGPHRDDFLFRIQVNKKETRDLATYGSRGEQRMGILWLKLRELAFVEDKTNENPTLLLDDIFSELDHPHRDVVFSVVGNQQTIITTADEHFIKSFKNSNLIKL
ncbi:MAG: DNA replication and repair protein RecF [Candidatus Woesebacteria bacterium]|nr:DNA replication and repair protein RecF [Candidatus Woesebacteria bacterium]